MTSWSSTKYEDLFLDRRVARSAGISFEENGRIKDYLMD